MKVLFYGAAGWIGQQFLPYLSARGAEVVCGAARVDDVAAVEAELASVRPDRVVSFVGRTHGPGCGTIDYLEAPGKLTENVRDNLFAPVALALLCAARGIHMTYLGTGCIFSRDGRPADTVYGEDDAPDFFGSSYSTVKGATDRLFHLPPLSERTLNVRIRMPISADRHPRNFVTKIVSYEKICSSPNSMTVLPTLLPILADLIAKGEYGTIHLVNPGAIEHNEILAMYRDIVDPAFRWTNFSLDEQHAILKSHRSNNELDTSRLQRLYPDVPDIRTAVRECLTAMAAAS